MPRKKKQVERTKRMSELLEKRFEHKKPKYYHTYLCFNSGEMEAIPYDTPEEVEASILTAIHDPSWQCPFCLERPAADYRGGHPPN